MQPEFIRGKGMKRPTAFHVFQNCKAERKVFNRIDSQHNDGPGKRGNGFAQSKIGRIDELQYPTGENRIQGNYPFEVIGARLGVIAGFQNLDNGGRKAWHSGDGCLNSF